MALNCDYPPPHLPSLYARVIPPATCATVASRLTLSTSCVDTARHGLALLLQGLTSAILQEYLHRLEIRHAEVHRASGNFALDHP